MKFEIKKIATCILFSIIPLSFVFCGSETKNVKSVSCYEDFQAKNSKGIKLGEVFIYKDFSFR